MAADLRTAPVPTPLTEPYWDAARRGELVLQQCADCARFTHPPAEWCRFCGSERRGFAPVSGVGVVETFSVVHRTFAPGFAGRVPYVIAWVGLDEQPGLRMFGNVLGVPADHVHIGQRVELVFEEIDGFGTVPNFQPAGKERSCGSE
ncbi:Zn-ribbon domain-containing OB-fold protein [Amycolatopsis sp. 3B14]|uniref:Zn-ribbon domain-containing OB-fold protein n=1 Tax=Amycolatopsis sp. 3B14 TaxID=3243600 RepID=UPI003D971FEE